jgi:hypothetical protein
MPTALEIGRRALNPLDWADCREDVKPLVVAGLAMVMSTLSLVAGVLGVWRVSADLGWMAGFFVKEGPLSHYQPWLGIAIGSQAGAHALRQWLGQQTAWREHHEYTHED